MHLKFLYLKFSFNLEFFSSAQTNNNVDKNAQQHLVVFREYDAIARPIGPSNEPFQYFLNFFLILIFLYKVFN